MKSQFQLRSGRRRFHWLLPRHRGDFEPHSETPIEFQQFTSMAPNTPIRITVLIRCRASLARAVRSADNEWRHTLQQRPMLLENKPVGLSLTPRLIT